jgi:hypothetical protein
MAAAAWRAAEAEAAVAWMAAEVRATEGGVGVEGDKGSK